MRSDWRKGGVVMRSACISHFATWIAAALIGVSVGGDEVTPLGVKLTSEGFELIEVRDGVTVYKHPIETIVRTAGEGTFQAPPGVVRDVLIDYERQVGRVGRVSEAVVLERGQQSMLVYQRLNLPVISDRDYNIVVEWGQRGDVTWITYTAVSGRGRKAVPGVVRVTRHSGSWQLRARKGGNATFARFQVSLDVAGLVPMWLVRSGAAKELPRLFADIGGILEDGK